MTSPPDTSAAPAQDRTPTAAPKTLRVLIADDYPDTSKALWGVLEFRGGFELVGEAASGQEALRLAQALRPDAVVMDLRMAGGDGLEATRQIRQALPATQVVLLSVHTGEPIRQAAIEAGAAAFVAKDRAFDELARAVRQACG